MNEETPRKVSSYEFALHEGASMWERLKKQGEVKVDVGVIFITASILLTACVVGEAMRSLNDELKEHNHQLEVLTSVIQHHT